MTTPLEAKKLILAVDDNPQILRLQQTILEAEGLKIITASNGEDGVKSVLENNPDLVLLDIQMPKMDGYTACKRIREFSTVPIIFLTVEGAEDEKVKGLEIGADDFVTKPFSSRELLARVRAVLRRRPQQKESTAVVVGDLQMDFIKNRVTIKDKEILLTDTEFRLLGYLARNHTKVVPAEEILEKVWSSAQAGDYHTLRVTMNRLREKLGDDARKPLFIVTRPGIGYTLGPCTLEAA